jgi:plasmid maintenance system antidote protein VapI
MSNLQAQADITANMTLSLQQRFNAMSDMSANISRQIDATQALNKSLEVAPKNIENLNSSLENILIILNNIEKIKF